MMMTMMKSENYSAANLLRRVTKKKIPTTWNIFSPLCVNPVHSKVAFKASSLSRAAGRESSRNLSSAVSENSISGDNWSQLIFDAQFNLICAVQSTNCGGCGDDSQHEFSLTLNFPLSPRSMKVENFHDLPQWLMSLECFFSHIERSEAIKQSKHFCSL